jgi:hypothetical protein
MNRRPSPRAFLCRTTSFRAAVIAAPLPLSGIAMASSVSGFSPLEVFGAISIYWILSLIVSTGTEAVILRITLDLTWRRALALSGLVNLISHLAGVPLGLLLGGSEHELVPLASYWRWSTLALFVAASLLETAGLSWRIKDRAWSRLLLSALAANTGSYGLFLLRTLFL